MFDPIHAVKCARNNLLNKDLELDYIEADKNINTNENVERKYASWDHVQMAYDIDQNGHALYKCMPKLTDAHIRPFKMKKMKVSCCTEAESETMSQFICHAIDMRSSYIILFLLQYSIAARNRLNDNKKNFFISYRVIVLSSFVTNFATIYATNRLLFQISPLV